jgi:hypothetical protein
LQFNRRQSVAFGIQAIMLILAINMSLNLTESHIWLNFAEKNRPLSGKCSRGISDIML